MPNIYISEIGDDVTGDGSALLPYKTFGKAKSVAINGDDIIASDGAYNEATFLSISGKTDLTFRSENKWGAVFTGTPGQSRCFHIDDTSPRTTIKDILFDGDNACGGFLTVDSGAPVRDIVCTGNKTKGFTGIHITTGLRGVELTIDGGWVAEQDGVSQSVLDYANAYVTNGSVSISDGAIQRINITGQSRSCISVAPSVAGTEFTAHDIVLNMHYAAGHSGGNGIFGRALKSADVYDVSITGTTNSDFIGVTALTIQNDNGGIITSDFIHVHDCNVYYADLETDAKGIEIGNDANITETIQSAKVWNNVIQGTNHSMLFGSIIGGKGWGNYSKNSVIGALNKHTTDCEWSGNVITEATGQFMRSKADANGSFCNNTCIDTLNGTGVFMYANSDDSVNSNTMFKNNNCYHNIARTQPDMVVNDTSTADVDNNNIFGTAAKNATVIYYPLAASYASWSLAEAAEATINNITEVDPLFTDLANLDLSLQVGSPLVSSGIKWWTGANPIGADGEPFSDFDIDIGAIQSKHSPFHPVNL